MNGMISGILRHTLHCLLAGAVIGAGLAFSPAVHAGEAATQAATAPLQKVTTYEFLDKLAAHHGKVILVNFFAEYCGPCRREIPELMKMREEFSQDDLVIIGVAVDQDIRQAQAFVDSIGVTDSYSVYYGGAELAIAYRVSAIPFNVIYNRKGHIEASEAGYIPSDDIRRFLKRLISR